MQYKEKKLNRQVLGRLMILCELSPKFPLFGEKTKTRKKDTLILN